MYSSHDYSSVDITYTSTDKGKIWLTIAWVTPIFNIAFNKGRGCGGVLYNYRGKFTSPMYPDNYRNESLCTWVVNVPSGMSTALKFTGKLMYYFFYNVPYDLRKSWHLSSHLYHQSRFSIRSRTATMIDR